MDILGELSVSEFLLQQYASILQTADDSGVENGFVYESFLDTIPDTAHTVFLDPPPRFVTKLCKDPRFQKRMVTMHFTDPRIAEIYRTVPETKKLFRTVSDDAIVHALVFADYSAPAGVAKHLADLHRLTEKAKQLVIHLYMPNQLVDGKKHRKKMHQFLLEKYTVSKICTIEATAFETSRRRHCVITLEEQSIPQKSVIPIQCIRRTGDKGGYEMYAEAAVNAPVEMFRKGNKTISGLAEDACKRINVEMNRKDSDISSDDAFGPRDFVFSPEIIGRGSVIKESSNGKTQYRLKMNMYGKPNARQERENIEGRGSPLLKASERPRDPRKETPSEALVCAFQMLDHPKIRRAVCDDLKSRVKDDDFSLFSFWYYQRDQIEKNAGQEKKIGVELFYNPKHPWDKVQGLRIRTCKESDIRRIMERDKSATLGQLRRNTAFLHKLFAIAVKEELRTDKAFWYDSG